MGKNKDFTTKSNPTMSFIDTGNKEEKKPATKTFKVEPKETPKPEPKIIVIDDKRSTSKAKAPEGYKPNPEYIETKSKRVQILLQPSLHEEVKAISKKLGISANDFIHRAIHEASYNDYVRGLIEKDIKEER